MKATYSAEIIIDHDIIRHVFSGRGRLSGDGVSMPYEKDDFSRFCIPQFWHYYLNQLGEGIVVNFPIKLKSVLKMSKKRFIVPNGELTQAPMSPMEKVTITVNRKACNRFSI